MSFNPLFEPNFLNLEYFFNRIYQWLISSKNFSGDPTALLELLTKLWWWALVISIILLGLIIHLLFRLRRIRQAEALEMASVFEEAAGDKTVRNERWENLQKYLETDNSSEWKLAIIEADTLLDEMVMKLGYQGENLGDRLKIIEPSDFLTLSEAWEAHKIRNRIAHEAGFQLTKREAKRIIGLFEKVFQEFRFI